MAVIECTIYCDHYIITLVFTILAYSESDWMTKHVPLVMLGVARGGDSTDNGRRKSER